MPPESKSKLAQGKGLFYPPDASIFERIFVRDYDVGTREEQVCLAGNQKVTKRKCNETTPQGQQLVYNLGDDMYKRCRPEAVHVPRKTWRDLFFSAWMGVNGQIFQG